MRIRHLYATFGRLDHAALELGEGLNILHAPNEAGKSTWCAFISAMLYGIDSRQRDRTGFVAEKNRYAPWSGAAMEGRMDCLADGRELTLTRETRRAAAPMAEFTARYAGTAEMVPGLTALNCGETLLGVPREVFERSAFIRQAGLGITPDAELERRIAALVTSGEEDTSYTEAAAALKRQLNRRRHNRTGEIPALEAEREEVCRTLETLRSHRLELAALEKQLGAAKAALAEAAARAEARAAWETAARRRAAREAGSNAQQAQARAEALKALLETEKVPENESIARLRGAIVNLETTRRAAEKARTARDEALKARLRAESTVNESVFAGQSAEEAKRKAMAAAAPRGHGLAEFAVSLPAVVVTAVTFVWLAGRPGGVDALPGAGVIAAGVAAALLCRSLYLRSAARARAAALKKRFGTADPAEIAALADTYIKELEAQAAAQTEAAARSASYDALYASLSANEQGILLEVRRFAPTAFDIPAADAALRECAVRRRELTLAQAAAREAAVRREVLAADADAEGPDELPPPPQGTQAELSAAVERARAELAAVQSRRDALSGQIAAAAEGDEPEARLSALDARLETLQGEYDAIDLALQALDEANTDLQNRFSPALGRRAAEIFAQLTEGRWNGVVLDRTLHLGAEAPGDGVARDAQLLSAGAADQLYLAVRLAVCELVLPPEKEAPLILDDALANFDDARCAAALRFLCREAQRRQILLFTCHNRESALLRRTADGAAAAIRELTNPAAQV